MPWVDELAAKLVTDSVGVLNDTIFISSKSTTPQAVAPRNRLPDGKATITITDTGGMRRLRIQNDRYGYERPSAQLVARAPTDAAAYALANAARDSLDGLDNVTIDGVRYVWLRAKQGPVDIGPDSKSGYPQYSFNVEAMKDPS